MREGEGERERERLLERSERSFFCLAPARLLLPTRGVWYRLSISLCLPPCLSSVDISRQKDLEREVKQAKHELDEVTNSRAEIDAKAAKNKQRQQEIKEDRVSREESDRERERDREWER